MQPTNRGGWRCSSRMDTSPCQNLTATQEWVHGPKRRRCAVSMHLHLLKVYAGKKTKAAKLIIAGNARRNGEPWCICFGPAPNLIFSGERFRELSKNLRIMRYRMTQPFFSFLSQTFQAKIYKRSVVHHLLKATELFISLTWKCPQPPTIGLWLNWVEEINKMEDLVFTGQHKCEQYSKTWILWNMFPYTKSR